MLKNKIVVVSGIGPGLGIKMAVLAAKEGAAGVVLAARTASKLDDAEAAIKKLDLDTVVLKIPNDITDRAQCDALVQQTVDRFGRIDALINSAYSHSDFLTAEQAQLDSWRQDMEVNVLGTMNMTLAVEPMPALGTYECRTLANDWTVVTLDGRNAAHYENTILITDGEPEILTL